MPTNAMVVFVRKMKPIADSIEKKWKIAPLITITQSALESACGISGLTAEANNLFGMTANETWLSAGKPVVEKLTTEISKLPPDQIHYWNKDGDIVEKVVRPDGMTKLTVKVAFRAYPTWDASVADWAEKIAQARRYASAYAAATNGDITKYAQAIKDAGYATDPDYSVKLIAVSNIVTEALG